MSLLDEIRDSAIRSETPVGELLRRLMVLGYRLDAEDLVVWVTAEMNGYSPDSTLPTYRPTIETHCVGEFELQMGDLPVGRDEYPISKSYFEGHDVEFLFRRSLRQPVAHYDDFLRLHPNEDMRKPWPTDAVSAFRTIGYKIQRGQKPKRRCRTGRHISRSMSISKRATSLSTASGPARPAFMRSHM